jgi:hypothetical protein
MADLLQYLKLQVIYPVTFKFVADEEISEVDKIRMKNVGFIDDDEFEIGDGFYNIGIAVPFALNPKCFIPKDFKRKRHYTEIIFEDGTIIFADGKPESVYETLNEYFIKIESMTKMSDNSNKIGV